jgi:archaellum biogenesis protein FlaJ (TadC family)
MEDKVFQVNLERSRIYWDYYKGMFHIFNNTAIACMLITAIIYSAGGLDLLLAAGIIALFFLLIVLLAALMSLTIWRHENKHLDELLEEEIPEPPQTQEPQGMPLV